MFNVVSKKIMLSLSVLSLAVGGFLLPSLTLAEDDLEVSAGTPTAYLERAEIIASGSQVNVYRVPTTNSAGEVQYFDLTVKFGVLGTGKFKKSATVTSVSVPDFEALGFIPGTYSDGKGGTCTMGVSAAAGGRAAGALACRDKDGNAVFNANWFTGPVAGHPLESDLVHAGIDKISGAQNVAWGNGTGALGGTWAYGCFYGDGNVISVHQAGDVLGINNFDTDSVINCNYSFVLQE